MAGSSQIRAGSAFVELFVTDNKLTQGLDRAANKFKKFGSIISGVGAGMSIAAAAVTAPLIALAYKSAESADQLLHASERMGVTIESLSELKYAAMQTGTDVETLEASFRHMGKSLVEAAGGSSEAQQAFASLGLKVADLAAMTPEERFEAIADAISKVHDPSVRAADAMKIFGKSGTQLLPMFADGAAGIEKWKERARELNLTSGTEGVRAAAQFKLVLNDLDATLGKLGGTLASAVIPILKEKTAILTGIIVKAIAWAKENKDLVATVFKVAAGVGVAGSALVGLGLVISSVGSALVGIGTAVGAVVTGFALLVSPIGLAVVAIGGAVAAFLYFSDTGKAVGNFILDVFHRIKDAIEFVFKNTSTAAGAWSALVAEAGYFVQDAWLSVKGLLVDAWYNFAIFMQTNFSGITQAVLEATNFATMGFLKAWTMTMSAYRSLVNTTSRYIFDAFMDNTKQLDAEMDAYINKAEAAGKLTHEQAQRARGQGLGATGYNEKAFSDRQNQIDAESDAKIAKIQADYEKRKAELKARANTPNAELVKQIADAKAKADAAIQAEKDKNAAAKKGFEDKLQKDHEASGEQSLWDKFFGKFAGVEAPKLTSQEDIGKGLDGVIRKTNTIGQFGGRGIQNLAGGGLQQQIADNTKKIADNTQKLIDQGVGDNAVGG